MINALRKSAGLPLWASICLIMAVWFASSHPARIPGFAAAHHEHAFDRVRSVDLYLVKDESKPPGPRKITGQQRFVSFHTNSDIRVAPALISFYATHAAEENPLVSIHIGTFHERAPPA